MELTALLPGIKGIMRHIDVCLVSTGQIQGGHYLHFEQKLLLDGE